MNKKDVHEIKRSVCRILDGNWANSDMGQLEEIINTQSLLVDSLSTLFALLLSKEIITIDEIKEFCEGGWRIDYE